MTPETVRESYELLEPQEGAAVVVLHGEHDLLTKTEMSDLFTRLIEVNELVVVDVSCADFIDSSFIHVILGGDRLARDRGSRFRLQMGTAHIVRRALEVSGILDVVDVASSRDEALGP